MTNNLKELISEKLEYYREKIRIIMKIEKELESKSLEQISDELIQEIKKEYSTCICDSFIDKSEEKKIKFNFRKVKEMA